MGCMQSTDASGGLPDSFLRNLSQHHQGLDVFAYYKVVRELGTGAFGVVNLVQNISTGDQYAMKVITIGPNAKVSVLRNEINLWRGLQHPNIVRLVETYESPTHIHMIMELCTGGHMLNAVKTRKQAFPEDAAKEIVRKLTSSIYYLHLKNICHRDIKLENILYETDQDGSDVKLCDFGASTLFRDGVLMQTVLGSVVYMAPEFLEGQYTQYMLLSNSMPFHGNTEEDLIESIFAAKLSFQDDVWADVSVEAKSLVKKLLNPNVTERYSSLQVLRHPWIASAKTNNLPTQDIDRIIAQLSEYASYSRMKRAALLAVAFCSPSIDTTAIRKAFDQLNVLHNGVLTLMDLEQAALTDQYPTVDFEKIFTSLDIENSNQVNFLEFVSATMTVNLQGEKVLRKAYGLFSPDETKGGITELTLGRVLGHDFDEASVKDMIRTADVDKDGAINYSEFVHLLEAKPVGKQNSARRSFRISSRRKLTQQKSNDEDSRVSNEPQPEKGPNRV